ncbi:MAG: efflux RND transporter periplasmic adaptor subunit [Acidobacteriaceae bacterium]|jgi:RND family efflux transporter MFP subunit|nr:efflux RND transporter periplasmic adaptor subunit [Acidobacteriaceae bacterium]
MIRVLRLLTFLTVSMSIGALNVACGTANGNTPNQPPPAKPAVAVAATAAVEQPVTHFITASGTLLAEEQASVAAEVSGRVVETPIERGTPIEAGAVLIRIAATESEAQAREAEANAEQIVVRLGLKSGEAFNVEAVPEVQNAKAAYDLAKSEFTRIQALLDQRVVSQSEFDQSRTQMEATRQQYEATKNNMAQQYQSLLAARARVTVAQKALADTVVRAPFTGLVAERVVSVGDYVNKGTKVAVVVRVNPLRVQLTVPEQSVSAVTVGAPVSFSVDAYPNRQFTGTVRYVSPVLTENQRALTLEAVVPNGSGELKPGLFATARIERPTKVNAVVVPAAAVRTAGGNSRVFVVSGDHVEERLVTIGQTIDTMVEITTGLTAGERVATTNVAQLSDGTKVS